jgi:hypothetical protein
MLITRRSPFSGQVNTMDLDITQAQLDEFTGAGRRRMVQDIFPHLSADEREFLMTGITPAEWAATFPEE